ncbi:DUF2842 domain-containing protein [uncultured Caulobacter sp.]|uniref:DUF2842 domain-containing protein n=1 Tax=uncultured Caulobacter sp. TaxID=158749 RepID=UPI0026288942|nr:DUF2842 domain-containing protein [uncultured Caulobacter sp.]
MSAPLIPARPRKLIGSLGVIAILFVWIWAFTSLYDRLPQNRLLHLAYFVVLGVGWVLPVIPLISWMGKADKPLDVGQK